MNILEIGGFENKTYKSTLTVIALEVCVDRTGGTVVLGDSFSMHIFQQSFKKMFEPDDDGSRAGLSCGNTF